MYKQASKAKLRIAVIGVGLLSVEQLWSANVNDLINTEELLQEEVSKLEKTSRRATQVKSKDTEILKLKLAIVSDVLDTLVAEQEARKTAADVKKHNAEIDALIAKKQGEAREGLSIEELEKLRK
jgi:hypothetical protein